MICSNKIIPASIKDAPALVKLVNGAYRGEGSKKGWTTEADLLDGIRIDENSLSKILRSKTDVLLKCCNSNNNIIGCVHLQLQSKKIYLGMLTVLPKMQAGGVGKQLLTAAEQYALTNNFDTIMITVISIRSELIAWYERRGYKKTGEIKPFPTKKKFGVPKQKLEFMVMEKKVK